MSINFTLFANLVAAWMIDTVAVYYDGNYNPHWNDEHDGGTHCNEYVYEEYLQELLDIYYANEFDKIDKVITHNRQSLFTPYIYVGSLMDMMSDFAFIAGYDIVDKKVVEHKFVEPMGVEGQEWFLNKWSWKAEDENLKVPQDIEPLIVRKPFFNK